jgi:chemotaxis protein methyltransferase CheR
MFGFFRKKDSNEIQKTQIKEDFSDITPITDYLERNIGISNLANRALVISKIKKTALAYNLSTTDEVICALSTNELFRAALIDAVTINETYFFREIGSLEWIVRYLKYQNEPIKIASFPSSSGEEIYSILILLAVADVDLSLIECHGYDINTEAIEKAQSGIYNARSLHKVPKQYIERFFDQNGNGNYQLCQSIKKRAHFFVRNVFDSDLGAKEFDIVLCRNMFIYFDQDKRKEALINILQLIKSGGIFIKGHADYIKCPAHLDKIEHCIYKKLNLLKYGT